MVWLYIECYELDELENLKKQDCLTLDISCRFRDHLHFRPRWLQIGGLHIPAIRLNASLKDSQSSRKALTLTVRFITDQKAQMSSRWRQRYLRCRQAFLGRMGTRVTPEEAHPNSGVRDPSRVGPSCRGRAQSACPAPPGGLGLLFSGYSRDRN